MEHGHLYTKANETDKKWYGKMIKNIVVTWKCIITFVFLTYYLDQIRKTRKWNGDESSQREYYLAHVHRTVIQMVKQI